MTPDRFRKAIAAMGDDDISLIISALGLGLGRSSAMEMTLKAHTPECGLFGDIAQDLDASLSIIEVHA